MQSLRKDYRLVSDINITPLTDVVLVLLIIFMVTSPFLIRSSIKVDLPKAKTSGEGASAKEAPLVLTFTLDKKIYLDDEEVKKERLISSLKRRLSAKTGKVVVISADQGVEYGKVVEILDLVKAAGGHKLAFATQDKK